MKFNTKCVHGSGRPDSTGAISPAIYMSSTFSHPKLGDTTGYQYTRESNPTRDRLEQLIAALKKVRMHWLFLLVWPQWMLYSIYSPRETISS